MRNGHARPLVDPDWGEVIRQHLTDHTDTAAVTGITIYHDSPVGFFLKLGYYIQDRRVTDEGRSRIGRGPCYPQLTNRLIDGSSPIRRCLVGG
ncbi:hypothetical protein ACIRRA_37735 [Nocardia sp. NPDC101769]|uniref:hypothetical protein n=1 Tax=Nocardia sp. NPDC101769 TaxID=3364333 RepID=UPI003806AFC7